MRRSTEPGASRANASEAGRPRTTDAGRARRVLLLVLAGATLTPGVARANERHFTYTYESAVLPPGARELEIWSTYASGREDFYSRLDQRAEFEVALSDRLMTSLYLNWSDLSAADLASGAVSSQTRFDGLSSEWKYKLSDPVADRLGSALYAELSLGTDTRELETKLILDKRFGANLLAYNLVVDAEWARELQAFKLDEVGLEHDLALTHFFGTRLAAGAELRSHTPFTSEHKPEYSALFLGPVASYTGDHWWATLTVLRQLPALKRSVDEPAESLVLNDAERWNVRLIFSYEW